MLYYSSYNEYFYTNINYYNEFSISICKCDTIVESTTFRKLSEFNLPQDTGNPEQEANCTVMNI